jgi:hypothetical protein
VDPARPLDEAVGRAEASGLAVVCLFERDPARPGPVITYRALDLKESGRVAADDFLGRLVRPRQ